MSSTTRWMGRSAGGDARRPAGCRPGRLGLAGLGWLAILGAPASLAQGAAPVPAPPASVAAPAAGSAAAPAEAVTPPARPSTVTLLPPTPEAEPSTVAATTVLTPRQRAERARLDAERALRQAEESAGLTRTVR